MGNTHETKENLNTKNLNTENLNDNAVLDALVLDQTQFLNGIVKAVFFTLIAIFVFFIPITFRNQSDVPFGILYKSIKSSLGLAGFWIGGVIIMGNGIASVYGKYLCKDKDSAIYKYYAEAASCLLFIRQYLCPHHPATSNTSRLPGSGMYR